MKMKDRKILLPGAMIWFSWKGMLESISVEDTFQIFDYFLGDLEDEDGEVMRYLGTNYLRLFSYFLIWPEEYTQHKNHKEIAEAIDKGDLAENAEYAAAKEAQGMLEMKISKLQDVLVNSRILDESKIDTNKIQILNKVKIKNKCDGKIMEYFLVSESEADLKNGKISRTPSQNPSELP